LAAALFAQLPGLIPTLVLISLLLDSTVALLRTRTADALMPALGLAVALLGVSFFSTFLFVLMTAAACQMVTDWLDGKRVSLVAAYAIGLRRFWRLAGAMLLACLLVTLGLAAIGAFLALFY